MTDRPQDVGVAAAPARRRLRFWPTAVASLACFAVIFEFLAFQLRAGNDPALGAGPAVADPKPQQSVIERRIVQRRVVHLPPNPSASTGIGTTTATAPAPAPASTPSVPAPPPAPAPTAVAPAPVVTSSS